MKLVNVRILDKDYKIKSDASGDKILQIAEYINEQMDGLRSSMAAQSRIDLAVMAAFKAASDYFQAKEGRDELMKCLEMDTARLASQIDDHLAKSDSK